MFSRGQIFALLETLAAASVTGVGLAVGGPVGAAVMAGIGINLGSDLIQGGYSNLKQRWLDSPNGLLNHDVQKALGRALMRALSSLEEKYFAAAGAALLRPHERESLGELFRELRENAESRLLESVHRIRLDPEIRSYLFNERDGGDAAWDLIVGDELLEQYGTELGDFVRAHLLDETLFWFGEELKSDNRDSNRAWRAFQRMVLEGIYADVSALKAGQESSSRDLRHVREELLKLDALNDQLGSLRETVGRLPDEPFMKEFERGLRQMRGTLQMIARLNERIDRNVSDIRRDVKSLLGRPRAERASAPQEVEQLLSEIRLSMFTADLHGLRSAKYRVEDLLSKNPTHPEALQLRDQIENAIRREAQPMSPQMAGGAASPRADVTPNKMARSASTLGCAVVVLFIVGLLLLLRWLGWL